MDYLVIIYDWEDEDFLWAVEQYVYRILGFILSCWECSDHFEEWLEENTLNLESQEWFAEWVLEAHNNASKHSWKEKRTAQMYSEKLLETVEWIYNRIP